jgi:FkbM family methyltransferase
MFSTANPQLRHDVHRHLRRYFKNGERDASVAVQPNDTVRPDSSPAWILPMLKKPDPHHPDFQIFRIFKDPQGVILDIGAHWGYSVGAIWSVGSRCTIISFEAMQLNEPSLKTIARFHPAQYKFKMVGLSDSAGQLKFVVPVINETPLGALSSACPNPDLDQLSNDICDHARQWYNSDEFSLRLWETLASVQVLDEMLASDPSLLQDRPVEAIKMDVEGFEFRVLKGATETLDKYRPLLMVEGGNQDTSLTRYLEEKKYIYTERKGAILEPVDGIGNQRNGFFIHKARIEQYRKAGILQ